jgi:uncharacterized protein (DUF302 family)
MAYTFTTKLKNKTINETKELVAQELKKIGFGVLTEIDMKETLKNKLDKDIKDYVILGACNPSLVFQALEKENKIGAFLPCNVIVQKTSDSEIEVSVIDPAALMQSVDNPELESFASQVQIQMKEMISNLK